MSVLRRTARALLSHGSPFLLAAFSAARVMADDTAPSYEIVGVMQGDYVQDFKRVDSNWDDTLRPSTIPTTDGAFGDDGQAIVSARQSGMGVNGRMPAGGKEFKFRFYFDLFGSGNSEGETNFHLQHAYGQWGSVLAGQTDTLFMDGDLFPNIIDYWGPAGMVYVRNAQLRWTFVDSEASNFAVAIEKPNDDIDAGQIRELDPTLGDSIQPDEKIPDLTSHYRVNGDWGHAQAAVLLRRIGFETVGLEENRSNDEFGWGINLTTGVNVAGGDDQILLGAVFGEGIASYMNDGGTDLAGEGTLTDPRPKALELLGLTAYYNHRWNKEWTSAIGYSRTEVDNTDLQSDDAFNTGQYASGNVLYSPNEHFLAGLEVLWGEREDKNGASGDDVRAQFSIRYSFSTTL